MGFPFGLGGRKWDFLLILDEGCWITFGFWGKDVRYTFVLGGRLPDLPLV